MPKDSIVTVFKDTIFIKDTLYSTKIITVYKDTIQKSELIELYQTTLDNQSSNYTLLTAAIIGLAVLLIGATSLWNFVFAERQIKQKVEEISDAHKQESYKTLETLIEEKFNILEKKLIDKIEEKDKEVQEKFLKTEHKFNEKFDTLKNELTLGLMKNEAEIARNFASSSKRIDNYTASLSWWIIALEIYVKLNYHNMIRLSIDNIIEIIRIENWYNDPHPGFDINKEIEKLEKVVPPLLKKEKDRIIKALKSKLNNE